MPRPTVPALEKVLGEPFPVLSPGFVRVVDYMGDDSSIVQAARVSYGRGTRTPSEDSALIRYLMRHHHTTPFEMCEIKFHIKLPIFVARQWVRHRTASINEYSARYSILDREFYIPSPEHLAQQSTNNRQGRGETLPPLKAQQVLALLREDSEKAYKAYTDLMNQHNLTRELARLSLSLNFYTQWYWKINLHNLLHFLSLRSDSHAQYEIRAYADTILKVLALWVPMTFEAFREYRLNAATLSATQLSTIRRMLAGEALNQVSSDLSPREWFELHTILFPKEPSV